jgi:hypothetical protein
MKKNINTIILVVIVLFYSSCYSTYSTYKGNVHQQAIGKTKNEILRSYGPPDQTQDDGAGGTIMMYEKFTQTTVTNGTSASYGRSSAVGGAIYGNNGVLSGANAVSGSVSSMSGVSQTSVDKTFCYLFLNKNNIVYDFKTNYGAQFEYNRCFDKTKTWLGVAASCFLVYPALVTIPWAIVAQGKAKKAGNICK